MSKIREGLGHSLPFQHGRKKCRSCSCVNSLISFGFLSASLEGQLPKLRRKGYCCQCMTHFGCCIKRKPRENIQVCVNVLPTSYRQVTNTLPTVVRQVAYILGKTCRPTVGRQTTDSRSTGFLGSSSSQLPKRLHFYCIILGKKLACQHRTPTSPNTNFAFII